MKYLLFSLLLLSVPAYAHEMPIGKATATIHEDGELTLRWELELVSYAMGNTPETTVADLQRQFEQLDREQQQTRLDAAADRLRKDLQVYSGEARFEFTEAVAQTAGIVIFRGNSVSDPLRFRFPKDAGAVVMTVESGGSIHFQQLLLAGEESPWITVGTTVKPDPIVTGWRYLLLGFEHILPLGLDHILFVLGLFLLNPGVRPLLLQITAFTVAHSITLALSMTGVFSLPGEIVEPAIAASIAFVALENVFARKLHPWRLGVVFLFGLVHGLGFAGVLRELGIPGEQFTVALISFNVGVEFGQLTVVALALLATSCLMRRTWYRSRVAIPASLLIASVGVYWTIERIASA